ncbi:MAG: alpha/beta hydrolase [Burkholderiaceae bacterium]|nr:alpha/beta hydrolase [Burkholderiaceae bacterium]
MSPRSHYLVCHEREIHYREWGAGNPETVIAWHGLARTCRDMDDIAQHLAARYRVICPDTIGRGLSQWSPQPDDEYCLAFYARLAVSLADQLGLESFHWLGTSMGGAIGLRLAAGAMRGRIRRLVLNDIGPELGAAAVQRIRSYAGRPPQFERVGELEQYFRTVYKPYGSLSDQQWRRLTETSTRRMPDGKVTPHYDPLMVAQFEKHPRDYDQWEAYRAIDVPTLCLRGETSDLLLPEVAEAMRSQGPHAIVVEIAGCGHAPALNVAEQFQLVERFLNGSEAAAANPQRLAR